MNKTVFLFAILVSCIGLPFLLAESKLQADGPDQEDLKIAGMDEAYAKVYTALIVPLNESANLSSRFSRVRLDPMSYSLKILADVDGDPSSEHFHLLQTSGFGLMIARQDVDTVGGNETVPELDNTRIYAFGKIDHGTDSIFVYPKSISDTISIENVTDWTDAFEFYGLARSVVEPEINKEEPKTTPAASPQVPES